MHDQNQRIFELQKSIVYHEKPIEKVYPKVKKFKNSDSNYYHQKTKNPKSNPGTWCFNEKSLIIVGRYVSLERS